MQLATPFKPITLPSRWTLGVGLVALAHFANDAATSMFPALLPSLATRFRLEPSELALLASVFAISTSLPQPFFGKLADRLGRERVGALGLALSAALLAALSLVASAPWLYVVLLVGGLGSAALHPAGMGLAREVSSKNPGLAVALFSSAGMAGGALGPLLAIGVASAWGLGWLAWAGAPVLFVALLLGRRQTRPEASKRAPSAPQTTAPVPMLRLLRGPVGWLALVALLANLVALTFMNAVPVWLVTERGLEDTSPVIGLTLAAFSMAAAIGGIAGGLATRSLGPRHLIVGSLGLSVVALESVLVTVPGSAPYLVAVALAGGLLGLNGPVLISRAQELARGSESGVAGILLGGTSALGGLLYAGLGAAEATFGLGTTLAAISLVVLPAAHVAAVVLKDLEPAQAHGPCLASDTARTCQAAACCPVPLGQSA